MIDYHFNVFFNSVDRVEKISTVFKAFSHFNNIDKTIIYFANMFNRFMIGPMND